MGNRYSLRALLQYKEEDNNNNVLKFMPPSKKSGNFVLLMSVGQ